MAGTVVVGTVVVVETVVRGTVVVLEAELGGTVLVVVVSGGAEGSTLMTFESVYAAIETSDQRPSRDNG